MILVEASYDADVMGSSQIRRTGEGGRIGADRRKTTPERRRVRATGGGQTAPVTYKPRKDIGQQRPRSEREEAPQQERGSADVAARAAAAAREERAAAARARIAAKKKAEQSGGSSGDSESSTETPKPKPTAKDLSKEASKLLSTKKPEQPVHPDYTPPQASGKTRAERDRERNQAKKNLYNERKTQLFAQYKEVHGTNPTGKERTKLLALAHKSLEG